MDIIMNLTGRTIHNYRFQERLSADVGMAQVYRATSLENNAADADVAIKVIHQQPLYTQQPGVYAQMLREARILTNLRGIPHIVDLYAVLPPFEELECVFMVMPLMKDGTLRERMNGTPIPIKTALEWMRQIVSGLAYAHAKGIVHRDIKPSNLLLTANGEIKVSDFGIAKVMAGTEATLSGSMTLEYAAPEQWQNIADPRTDLFSLTVVLFEMLTGQHPFVDPQTKRYLRPDTMPFPSILPLLPTVGAELDAVLLRAAALSPEDRYSNLTDFMNALESALTSYTLDGVTRIGNDLNIPLEASNPFKGLKAFDDKDAALFFGREAFAQELIERLKQDGIAGRFLAVVGPSGAGKSSVVRAGLIPALKGGALHSSARWRIAMLKPGDSPLKELHGALRASQPRIPDNFMKDLESADGLAHALRWLLPADDPGIEQLVVIDQAEELFSLTTNRDERQHFLDILIRAVSETNSRLRVILTLRADFMDRPLLHPELAELLRKFTAFVVPLKQAELRAVITQPLAKTGASFDPGLVEVIMAQVEDQSGALPLLQHTLAELYDRDGQRGRRLTRKTYEAMGGVIGSLGQSAERIFQELDAPQQAAARQLFLRLIAVGDDVEDTRRRAPQREVLEVASQTVLDRFAQHRLLTLDRDRVNREATVELGHEALLNAWERLQTWRDETREDRLIARRLTQMVEEWARNKHHPDYLLFGSRLQEYETWQSANTIQLTPQESQFLKQSRAEQDKQLKRTRRTRWISRAAAIGFLVVVSGFGISNVQQRTEIGQQQATLVVQEQELAARLRQVRAGELTIAANNAQDYTETAALLAVCALEMRYSPEADAALVRAVDGLYTEKRLVGYRNLLPTAFNPIPSIGEMELLNDQRFVSLSQDGTLRLWSREGDWIRDLTGMSGNVSAFHLLPDNRIIIGEANGTLGIWNLEGTLLQNLMGHSDSIRNIELATDGTIVTSSNDNTVRWWSMNADQVYGEVHSENFNSNGYSVTVMSDNHVVVPQGSNFTQVFDTSGVLQFTVPKRFISEVEDGIFYAEDQAISGIGYLYGRDGTIITSIRDVRMYKFLPTGRFLVMVGNDLRSTDNLIRLYQSDGDLIAELALSNVNVDYPTIGALELPDGRMLLWRDKTMGIWDLTTGSWSVLNGHTNGSVFGAIPLEDGRILTWNGWPSPISGEMIIWSANFQRLYTLTGHSDAVLGAVEIENGHILSRSKDGTVRIWNLTQNERRFQQTSLSGLVILAENRRLTRGGNKLFIRSATGEILHTLSGHTSYVSGVMELADGRILSWGHDNTLRLWSSTGEALHVLSGHTSRVNSAILLTDGRILSWSSDGTLRLWSSDGESLRVLSGHTSGVGGVQLLADGRILSWSGDGTLRTWDVDYRDFIEYAWTRIFRDFTSEERQRFGLAAGECPYRGQ
ncbi:MAG: protein kinase [Anaerolineae bacterium]|nr:protein kinase [Anaerolineae bacterium]